MEIIVKLNKEDIIKEVEKEYFDDIDFIFQIVDKSCDTWISIKTLTKLLLVELQDNGEIDNEINIDELLNLK